MKPKDIEIKHYGFGPGIAVCCTIDGTHHVLDAVKLMKLIGCDLDEHGPNREDVGGKYLQMFSKIKQAIELHYKECPYEMTPNPIYTLDHNISTNLSTQLINECFGGEDNFNKIASHSY